MHSPQGAAEEVFQSVDRTETVLLRIRYRVAIRQSLERETFPQVHLWEMFRQKSLAGDGADLGSSAAVPTSLKKAGRCDCRRTAREPPTWPLILKRASLSAAVSTAFGLQENL
jgi:hypothetical protein